MSAPDTTYATVPSPSQLDATKCRYVAADGSWVATTGRYLNGRLYLTTDASDGLCTREYLSEYGRTYALCSFITRQLGV